MLYLSEGYRCRSIAQGGGTVKCGANLTPVLYTCVALSLSELSTGGWKDYGLDAHDRAVDLLHEELYDDSMEECGVAALFRSRSTTNDL